MLSSTSGINQSMMLITTDICGGGGGGSRSVTGGGGSNGGNCCYHPYSSKQNGCMTNREQRESTLERGANHLNGHVEVKPQGFFLWPQCCYNCKLLGSLVSFLPCKVCLFHLSDIHCEEDFHWSR